MCSVYTQYTCVYEFNNIKFFNESNRTEYLSEFSIDIFSIFFREKQLFCFSLKKIENISIENSDKYSVLLLFLKNFNIIQFMYTCVLFVHLTENTKFLNTSLYNVTVYPCVVLYMCIV